MKKSIWIPLVALGGAGTVASVATAIYFATRTTSYTINLDLDGGKIEGVGDSIKVAKGATIGSLPTPTKTDCIFKGWKETEDGNTLDVATVISGDMNLKAVYEAQPQPTPTGDISVSGKYEIYSMTSSNAYTATSTIENLTWKISGWSGSIETEPKIEGTSQHNKTIKTFVAGEFDLVVTNTDATVSDAMHITIVDPMLKSNKIWLVYPNAWHYIESWDKENITLHPLEGQSINVPVDTFDGELFFGDNVQAIGNAFLKGCTSFNSQIHFNDDLQVIGDEFLKGCTAFNNGASDTENKYIDLKCNYIGNDFLYNCTSFDNSVVVDQSVGHVGENFMFNCTSMTKSSRKDVQITISTSYLNFSADAGMPLTFAAFEKDGTVWSTNGLPVVFSSQTEMEKFCGIFKNMEPTPEQTDLFYRNISGSYPK